MKAKVNQLFIFKNVQLWCNDDVIIKNMLKWQLWKKKYSNILQYICRFSKHSVYNWFKRHYFLSSQKLTSWRKHLSTLMYPRLHHFIYTYVIIKCFVDEFLTVFFYLRPCGHCIADQLPSWEIWQLWLREYFTSHQRRIQFK